jgi:hypothetical protein
MAENSVSHDVSEGQRRAREKAFRAKIELAGQPEFTQNARIETVQ